MNRIINFRGMTLGGDWVYGNLSHIQNKIASYKHVEPGYYISNAGGAPFAYAIRPETIGQFIGTTDNNGMSIYEGDILGDESVADEHGTSFKGLVGYLNGAFRFVSSNCKCGECFESVISDGGIYKVLGNIYNNPELIRHATIKS